MAAVMLFLRQSTGKTERYTHFCMPLKPVFTRDCGDGVHFTDEPTGNLDTVSAKKIMDNFTEINGRKKKAVVVVTHDPVVASYARRILFIKDGKIMKQMENHPKQQENIRAISDAMLDL